MDLDRVEPMSVIIGAKVDTDTPQGEISVNNFIPTLNTALTADEEYGQDAHSEMASPAVTQLIPSRAFQDGNEIMDLGDVERDVVLWLKARTEEEHSLNSELYLPPNTSLPTPANDSSGLITDLHDTETRRGEDCCSVHPGLVRPTRHSTRSISHLPRTTFRSRTSTILRPGASFSGQ